MNIALVCDSVNLQHAGSLISTWRYATGLIKRGNKVVLISTGEENSVKVESGVKVVRIGAYATPGTGGGWRMPLFVSGRKLKKIYRDEEIDVVHFMIPTPLCFVGANVAKKMELPVVGHSHTQPENILMVVKMDFKVLNWLFYKYLLWFYGRADVVVCPTKFAESKLKMYSDKINTEVVSNGVDLNQFKKMEVPDKFYSDFNLNKGKKSILYVGRIWPEKNIKVLIKAMPHILKRDKDIHLNIVGKQEKDYDMLNKLVDKLGLRKNVTFLGRVSDEDLVYAYNACDVFCLPSFVELEGMVVLEAMGLGKPIVISDSKESASRFYVDGNGYNFETTNEVDLSEKLLKLLGDKNLRKKMGKKSLEIVKNLEMGKCVEDLEKVYLKIIKGKSREKV